MCCPQYESIEIEVQNKYYCLSAAAALLKYIEFIENVVYAHKSIKVVFEGLTNTMLIDPSTAKSLELIVNNVDPRSKYSLFDTINCTHTRSGFRLLRSNILQPSTDLDLINKRLDLVEELVNNETLFSHLGTILGHFGVVDVDHLLSLFVQIRKVDDIKNAESKIENIIYLKHVINLIQPLKKTIAEGQHQVLKQYFSQLEDERIDLLKSEIDKIIDINCRFVKGAINIKTQKCNAIKAGISGLLDVAREAYSDAISDVENVVFSLSNKYSMMLKSCHSVTRGFYCQLHLGKNNPHPTLPPEFIKVSRSNNSISFTTEDLIKCNNRIDVSTEEIYLLSNE